MSVRKKRLSPQVSDKPGIAILLVEDNPGDIRLTEEAFKECSDGVQLHVVNDGLAALDFLYKRGRYTHAPSPGLILLDLNLPKKDGRQVLAEIKNDPHLKQTPVVVLTTSKAEDDILRTYDLHANCYLTKPVELDQFIELVQSLEQFWICAARLPGNSE